MILQTKDLAHRVACIKCLINESHHPMSLNSTPSRSLGRIPLCIIIAKHTALERTPPFCTPTCVPGPLVFIFYRGWGHILCRAAWLRATGQEITDPSEHSSVLLPALSSLTHQKLRVLISRMPEVHLFGIVLNFAALSCSQSSQGTRWPCVGLGPGRRRVSAPAHQDPVGPV